MDGNGKMTYPDGRVEDGLWKDGKFAGSLGLAVTGTFPPTAEATAANPTSVPARPSTIRQWQRLIFPCLRM